MNHRFPIVFLAFLACLPISQPVAAGVITVPGDFSTVQAALDAAQAGDTVEVAVGVYNERVSFPRDGLPGSPITLRSASVRGGRAVLDGTGLGHGDMVLLDGRSHLRVEGLEIRNLLGASDASGVRILGSGSDLVLRDLWIHDIRGDDAMGITVYGTEDTPIEDLTIDGNLIEDCDPARSEALTLNGNVRAFAITNNTVRDVNNIGIDMIGGETDIQSDPMLVAREGVVRGNTVIRANSVYEGGYAGGIYVDGGRDIVIENNLVMESDLGLEIGAENAGLVTDNIVVRNNVLALNERAGLVFGGYAAAVGRVADSEFRGNTLYHNNTVGESGQGVYFQGGGIGEIWVQFADNNVVANNLVVAGPENVFVGSFDAGSNVGNAFDFNLYWSADGVENGDFSWNGAGFTGFAAWATATGNGASSVVADPLLADPANGDYHLDPSSPAVDAGDPAYTPAVGESDLDGGARRVGSAVEIGADELDGGALFGDGFESGDTTAWGQSVGGAV